MRVVWKFPIAFGDWQPITFGQGGKIVLVDIDPVSDRPTIWVEHQGDAGPVETRYFGIFPTGGSIAENADHVGSTIDRLGGFVWHIYERRA